MAIPLYTKHSVGTVLQWLSSGGDYTFTPTSLANTAARQGAKGDLGAYRAKYWQWKLYTKFAVAPTSGKTLGVYWSNSGSGTAATDNQGGCSGSDGSLSNPSEVVNLLQRLGFVSASNLIGTGEHRASGIFMPQNRYGMPVLYNIDTGQALSSTAGDHAFIITPIEGPLTTTTTG